MVPLFDGINEAIVPHVTSQFSQYTQKGYWSFSDVHGLVSFSEGHIIMYRVAINSM